MWLVGSATGAGTGFLFFLATTILSNDDLTLPKFSVALITPSIVAFLMSMATRSNVLILLIVAYLTLVMPVLGALFGAPNSDIRVVLMIITLGLAGGLVWSTPFALWAYIRRRKAD